MKWKPEHVIALLLIGIMAFAILGAFLLRDRDLINVMIMPIAGGVGGVIGYYFGKKDGQPPAS